MEHAPRRSLREMEAQLGLIVRHALTIARPEESDLSIANRIFDAEGRTLRPLTRHIMVQHIFWKVQKARTGPLVENQLPIPGIKLPRVIGVPHPKTHQPERIVLRNATLPQLVAYRKILVERKTRRIKELDKAIRFMRKYAPHSRKVTLAELVEKHGQQILFEMGARKP